MARRTAALALLALGCLAAAARAADPAPAAATDPAPAAADPAPCDKSAPQPPLALQLAPADGKLLLRWKPPANAACVAYTYEVSAAPLGPTGAAAGTPTAKLAAAAPNATLSGLPNDVLHKIFVKAVARAFAGAGAEASAQAAPARACDAAAAPAAPAAVTATPGATSSSITLCWAAPTAGGCASEYRVAFRMVPLTDDEARRSAWTTRSLKYAGCVEFANLAERRSFQFAVQAWSAGARAGAALGATATAAKAWRCFPVAGAYPLCAAARSGACNPQSCAEQAAAGQCGAPWLRQADPAVKTVVQYCADYCGCSLEGVGAPAAEPAVAAMAGPGALARFDQEGGCCRA